MAIKVKGQIVIDDNQNADFTGNIKSGGIIEDSHGPLRRLVINSQSDNYTLVSTDAGKLVRQDSGDKTINIPIDTLTAGDMITIFNVSSGNLTIDGSDVTLYNTIDGNIVSTCIASPKGVCTIACTAVNEFIISGSGLS